MTIKELWHTDSLHTEIRTKELLPPDGTLIIRSEYSLISAGTERIVASGLVPEEIYSFMKVPGMEGSFSFPLKYGYSVAGKVAGGPAELMGKCVHLMYPHQDFILPGENEYTVVPDTLGPRKAVMAPIMETALNAVWDSHVSAGDQVLVCGFGIVGAMTSMLLQRFPGVHVSVCEKEDYKNEIATSLGFSLFNSNNLPEHGFDVAFNTSASGSGLQICLETTAIGASVVEMSWYGSEPQTIHLGRSFHPGRKRIVSSQVSSIPFERSANFSRKRRRMLVFDLLADHVIDKLPVDEIPFGEAPSFYETIRKKGHRNLCTVIKY